MRDFFASSMRNPKLTGAMLLLAQLAVSSGYAQWSVVNLHPPGQLESALYAVSNGRQVGNTPGPGGALFHAGVWSGTSGSWIDLNPAGASDSYAHDGDGLSQVGMYDPTGTAGPRAALWTGTAGSLVDLHPNGAGQSYAYGVSGNQQVGRADGAAALWFGTAASMIDLTPQGVSLAVANGTDGVQQVGSAGNVANQMILWQASLWSGSAASWINLHPQGAVRSDAYRVDNGQQVGNVYYANDTSPTAALWSGSAASYVNLNPAGASLSAAWDVSGGVQAGAAIFGGAIRAGIWFGSADSWHDLHQYLPDTYGSSQARGVWRENGVTYVAGFAHDAATGRSQAMMWVSPVPEPGTCVALFGMFAGYCFKLRRGQRTIIRG